MPPTPKTEMGKCPLAARGGVEWASGHDQEAFSLHTNPHPNTLKQVSAVWRHLGAPADLEFQTQASLQVQYTKPQEKKHTNRPCMCPMAMPGTNHHGGKDEVSWVVHLCLRQASLPTTTRDGGRMAGPSTEEKSYCWRDECKIVAVLAGTHQDSTWEISRRLPQKVKNKRLE